MTNKKKDNVINFPSSPTKLEKKDEKIIFSTYEPL